MDDQDHDLGPNDQYQDLGPNYQNQYLGPNDQDQDNPLNSTVESKPPPMTDVFFDYLDLVQAIEAIPNGSSPGPDGIPTVMLKRAKVPIARMLYCLFRTSIDKGHIPDDLKHDFVIPVHKGGSRLLPEEYRPISLTSHLMKSGERVIRKYLVGYLEMYKKFDPNQHGSRNQRSTLSQLLVHHDEIVKALENGDNIDVIYLDFKKAFDKVDHGILLQKLRKLGISGKIGRWIHNFLKQRQNQVLVKGKKSRIFPLISGVPQGSVLGPLLFLLFIGDISEGVGASTLLYVDDSKVKQTVNNEDEVEHLQEDLDKIYKWQRMNNMEFNSKKFLVMRYGKNSTLKQDTEYFTGEMETVIEQVENCKDLGVILSDDATFEHQIDKVTKKARQKGGWIMRTFYSREQHFMRHMYNTLVQPHLDYCVQLWAPPEGPQMDKIEDYTKKIPFVREKNYWERLKILKMNSEQRRIERYKILYTWKVLQNKMPNPGISTLPYNEIRGRKCYIPFTRNKKRLETFQISGSKPFNCLPEELRNITTGSEDEFKTKLDAFLGKIPDEPRCPGLTPGATDMLESRPTNSLQYQIQRAWRERLPCGWMNQLAS